MSSSELHANCCIQDVRPAPLFNLSLSGFISHSSHRYPRLGGTGPSQQTQEEVPPWKCDTQESCSAAEGHFHTTGPRHLPSSPLWDSLLFTHSIFEEYVKCHLPYETFVTLALLQVLFLDPSPKLELCDSLTVCLTLHFNE